jgi:hypothetical protein
MRLAVLTEAGSSRSYFSIDVFVNGEKRDSLNNFEGVELPENYTLAELPLGEFEKTFDLGDGEKEVCLYLPWSVKTWIRELHLDDGAFVTAVKPKNVLLAFGDSITQGYDALYPSDMYITRFAEYLDALLINKAIGAEIFVPPLAQLEDWIIPDIITVAYGTNDWSKCGKAEFTENCKAFFKNLQATYPYADIVAITPIWRKDADCTEKSCAFAEVEDIIRACTADIENVRVISGFDFVPQQCELFSDMYLHPNDEGFLYYAYKLIYELDKYL